MGCVFAREFSGKAVERRREEGSVRVDRKVSAAAAAAAEAVEIRNGNGGANHRKESSNSNNEQETTTVRPRGEKRRSSKPNPRHSNPPKHVHGEQVAAGWPSWLSAVAGEAISGWTPRRADTFEKLDKVVIIMKFCCDFFFIRTFNMF